MMGTTREPMPGSRKRLRSRRAKAMVVETACFPDPARTSAKAWSPTGGSGLALTTLLGMLPASALRLSMRYSWASVPGAGR